MEYVSTPIYLNGKLHGAVVIFRDISERKRIEAERKTAFEEVKRLKDALEQERDYLRDEINITINCSDTIGESQALKRTLAKINLNHQGSFVPSVSAVENCLESLGLEEALT